MLLTTLNTPSPTVFVIDEECPGRHSLEHLLRSAGYHVASFSSGFEFLESAGPDACGCVLADLQMPDISGLELLTLLSQRQSALSTVLISRHASVAITVNAMKLGAQDFLTRPFDEPHLLDVVDSALSTSVGLWAELQEVTALRVRYDSLTRRQREVCWFVSDGHLNKQIAGRLGTSEKTVKVHRAAVMSKMQAGSVAELVRIVDRLGVQLPRTVRPAPAWSMTPDVHTPRSLSCA